MTDILTPVPLPKRTVRVPIIGKIGNATVLPFPAKRLLPATDWLRSAILARYRVGEITRIHAIDSLIRFVGLSHVEAVHLTGDDE